jgi:hypothetical protein
MSERMVKYFLRSLRLSRYPSDSCKLAAKIRFRPQLGGRLAVGIPDCTREEVIADMTDATQIDLRFCDTTCKFIEFGAGV